MYNLVLEKTEESEMELPTSVTYRKSNGILEKHLLLLHWLCESLWLYGSQQTVEILKESEYQITLPISWETYMHVKKQQLELDMEQRTGSKFRK